MAIKLQSKEVPQYTGVAYGYRALASAIIEQALYDYETAVKMDDGTEKYSIRRFFATRVQDFSTLEHPNKFYLDVLDKIDSGEIKLKKKGAC